MPPPAQESARIAPPRIAARAACRILAAPRKEVRPKARRTKLAITPRAWSEPLQHPKRLGTTAPFSATAEMNCPTSRENSPAKPTPRPVTGGRERYGASTGPGGPPR